MTWSLQQNGYVQLAHLMSKGILIIIAIGFWLQDKTIEMTWHDRYKNPTNLTVIVLWGRSLYEIHQLPIITPNSTSMSVALYSTGINWRKWWLWGVQLKSRVLHTADVAQQKIFTTAHWAGMRSIVTALSRLHLYK